MFGHFLCWWVHYKKLREGVRETFGGCSVKGERTELWESGMSSERGLRVASSDFETTSRNLKIRDTPKLRLAMVG